MNKLRQAFLLPLHVAGRRLAGNPGRTVGFIEC